MEGNLRGAKPPDTAYMSTCPRLLFSIYLGNILLQEINSMIFLRLSTSGRGILQSFHSVFISQMVVCYQW